MNNLVWGLRCTSLALAIFCSSEARALDCAKAGTPVEQAICDNPSLKAADMKLSEQYFSALSRAKMIAEITGKSSVHESLLNSQRAFISQREKDCPAAAPNSIERCVADETAHRPNHSTTVLPLSGQRRPGPSQSDRRNLLPNRA
ncbi:MAG: lysozyme inhibitor LprI family protein [Bradyrhizobium sp.]